MHGQVDCPAPRVRRRAGRGGDRRRRCSERPTARCWPGSCWRTGAAAWKFERMGCGGAG